MLKPFVRLAAVAAWLGLGGVAVPALAQDVPVTVTIMQFEEIDDPDDVQVVDAIDGPDLIGDGDYYPQVRIGANPFEDRRGDFAEAETIIALQSRPGWTFTREVPIQPTVPVVLRMWDADHDEDDIIDINPIDSVQEVVAIVDLATCTWNVEGMQDGFISVVEGDGDIGHVDTFGGGQHGRLFFGISCGASGDIDSDGIPDTVERLGIVNSEGTQLVDMAALGADPCRADVAVMIDFMEGGGHSHRPTDAALDLVRAGFANASLPAVTGDDCPYPGFPEAETGVGLLTLFGEGLAEQAAMDMNDLGLFRTARMAREIEPFFHYAVFGHDVLLGGTTGRSGRCCANVKDFVVSLGSFPGPDSDGNLQNGSDMQQAGTFMHELGHSLGLAHWGRSGIDGDGSGNPVDSDGDGTADGANCKPNYLSVMNYLFQFSGLIDDDTGVQSFDYSGSALPALDEGSLSEMAGISDGTTQTAWCGPGGNLVGTPARGDAPVDWNLSGMSSDPAVSLDIAATNGSGGSCCRGSGLTGSPGQVLAGFNDWGVGLTFRAVMAPGADDENQVFEDEPTVEDAERMEAYWGRRLRCFPPETGEWVVAANCTIWRDAVAPGSLRVTGNTTLRVPEGVLLDLDLAAHAVRIEAGANLTVDPGGRVE